MDVVFLMDSSKDVNFINFIKEKAYVKLLAKRLNVSPGKSRAAVVVYGSSSQLRIDFDAYDSLSAFKTAVDGISYIGGTRRIDKALETAAVVLKKARNSIPKMVVLLTTGQQPLDAPSLASSAGALHLLGAMVYVISISNNLDPKYFGNLVEEISHVSQVSTFDLLNNTLPQVIRRIEDGESIKCNYNAAHATLTKSHRILGIYCNRNCGFGSQKNYRILGIEFHRNGSFGFLPYIELL